MKKYIALLVLWFLLIAIVFVGTFKFTKNTTHLLLLTPLLTKTVQKTSIATKTVVPTSIPTKEIDVAPSRLPKNTITIQQAEAYASQAGFSSGIVPGTSYTQIQVIVAIAGAESNYDTNAMNLTDPHGGSYGILQINGGNFGAEISKEGALNPRLAFQYAYKLSQGGTNFTAWSTFTDGKYLKYIPVNAAKQTKQLPAQPWWKFPRNDNYGTPDAYGGFPKPDSNILLPDNYPVINILPGTVSGINSPNGTIPAYGATVTIKLDKSVNNLATHIAYIHLAGLARGITIGTHVAYGQLIGYNGGNNAAGTQKAPLGFALTPVDYYGYGGQWTNTLGNPSLNPVPVINSFQGSNPPAVQAATAASPTTLPNIQAAAADTLSNLAANNPFKGGPNLIDLLISIDEFMTIYNPIPNIGPVPSDPIGVAIYPFSWLADLLINLMLDVAAVIVRSIFILLGVYLIFKVFDRMTNFTATAGRAAQLGLSLAAVA